MIQTVKFGDIFVLDGREYIFLAKIDDIVYAVEILNKDYSREVMRLASKDARRGDRSVDKLVFCFVELSTERFNERVAHMAKAGRGEATIEFDEVEDCLLAEDKEAIKKELVDNSRFFATELIETISKIR